MGMAWAAWYVLVVLLLLPSLPGSRADNAASLPAETRATSPQIPTLLDTYAPSPLPMVSALLDADPIPTPPSLETPAPPSVIPSLLEANRTEGAPPPPTAGAIPPVVPVLLDGDHTGGAPPHTAGMWFLLCLTVMVALLA